MDRQVEASDEQSSWLVRDRTFRRYPNINKQLLTDLYSVQGLSTVEIARHLGVSRNLVTEYNVREQAKARLAINSTKLVEDLVDLGVPLSPKSGKEAFIEFSTPALTWSFIRGVSDADGCIRVYERSGIVKGKLYGPYRRAKWSITIGTPFIYGFKNFLERNSIALSPRCIQHKQGTGLIEIANQDAIREIARRMYEYGTLWLQRKKDIFDLLG